MHTGLMHLCQSRRWYTTQLCCVQQKLHATLLPWLKSICAIMLHATELSWNHMWFCCRQHCRLVARKKFPSVSWPSLLCYPTASQIQKKIMHIIIKSFISKNIVRMRMTIIAVLIVHYCFKFKFSMAEKVATQLKTLTTLLESYRRYKAWSRCTIVRSTARKYGVTRSTQ